MSQKDDKEPQVDEKEAAVDEKEPRNADKEAEVDEQGKDSEDDEEEDSEPESAPPPKAAAKPSAKSKVAAPAAKPATLPVSRAGLFVVLALAAGGAAGWFGHIAQAKAQVRAADAAPAAVNSSGAVMGLCGAWRDKICDGSGESSAACQQATVASDLLAPSTCQAALEVVPATLARLKAARASCDSLVKKLCADLPPGSSTCEMVKERTPSFPPKRCDEMLKSYDRVIEELRSIDKQGGLQMGPGGPRGPGGPGPGHGPDDGHGH